MQIDKNLSFLDGYVQQSLENGAQPYIPESERAGMLSISNFMSQEDHESSTTHALRFEAYELPKPSLPPNVPPVLASSTELVHVPELSYATADVLQPATSFASASESARSDLKLRLDGVQKKWGRPTYTTPTPSTSSTDNVKIQSEATQRDSVVANSNSKTRDVSYDSKKKQVEISPEKQKLAASLFGSLSKPEGTRPSNQKTSKQSDKSHAAKAVAAVAAAEKPSQPPPDLMDLGEPSISSGAPSIDPFKQLEGLLAITQDTTPINAGGVSAPEAAPDFSSLFADMSVNVPSYSVSNPVPDVVNGSGLEGNTVENSVQVSSKGPNLKEALGKDARVRQVGVTPSGQNPNLFKDLLG